MGADSNGLVRVQLIGTNGKSLRRTIGRVPGLGLSLKRTMRIRKDIGTIKGIWLSLKEPNWATENYNRSAHDYAGNVAIVSPWRVCDVEVSHKGSGAVEHAVPIAEVRVGATNKVPIGQTSTTDCLSMGQEGCASCIDSTYDSCLSCKPGFFLTNLRRACGPNSPINGICQRFPKPGKPALVACTPGFDSTKPLGLGRTEVREEMCSKGASPWLQFKANEHSSDMSLPKRILAINTQLYKRVICEYKQGETAQCSNSKSAHCYLLCYMTRLDNPQDRHLVYTDNNKLKCESSRSYPATEMQINSGEFRGTACCYKECDIRKNPLIDKVLPNIKGMVSPADQPSSWSKTATMSF